MLPAAVVVFLEEEPDDCCNYDFYHDRLTAPVCAAKVTYTGKGTSLIQSSRNIVGKYISVNSRPSLKLGHVWSKPRALGQTL